LRSPLEVRKPVRAVTATAVLLVASACKGPPAEGPPARLVAGVSDTVVVNNERPVQLPIQVLDAAGHVLPDTGVRFSWASGVPVLVSVTGVATCTQPGDATVRASLGSLVTHLLVRCRPVRKVRGLRMMNLVLGDPPQELSFEAVGVDGRPVTLLTGQVTVGDSTIATLEGQRIRTRAPGVTWVTTRVGDREAHASVHVYERATTPEGIRPGQHMAVPLRLAGGEMRRWRLPAARELYFLAMLPDRDVQQMPRLAVAGANCVPGLDAHSFFCLALHDASVYVYHPQQAEPARELSGTLAVWRQERP
jgi:hypothetical protein